MGAARRKLALLGIVYATQGIGPGFTSFAVPVLLRRQGLSLAAVGAAGLLFWPWAVKFLWGPLADRLAASGKTRRVLVALQLVFALCLAGIAALPPTRALWPFLALLGLMNFVASVLDVATDGLAVRLLEPAERALGNSAQLGGYYVGSVVAGGLFLAVEPAIGWAPAVGILALLVASGLAAVLAFPASAFAAAPPQTREPAWTSLWRFLASGRALFLLPLIALLDLAQNFGVGIVGPFLLDAGVPQAQVGAISGLAGLTAALAGAWAGGLAIARLPRRRALVVLCALQAAPLFALAALGATRPIDVPLTAAAVALEYFLAGAFNVALNAWFMDWAAPERAATDYSLMSCAHNATYLIADPLAGASAGRWGFPAHFALAATAAYALLGVAWPLLARMERTVAPPAASAPA